MWALTVVRPVGGSLMRGSSVGCSVRPSMPPATTTSWPVTWPESVSEARTTTCAATSSGCATLRSAIVREIARTCSRVDVASRHRRLGPARRDGVHATERRDAGDLVLQGQQEPARDCRLRGRVVGVAGFSEDPRSRAHEDERPVSVALDLAQERPRHEKARGEVRAHGLLPASERELPDGHVLAGPDAGHGCAHVDRPERVARLLEQAVDVRLDREVGLGDRIPPSSSANARARSSPRWKWTRTRAPSAAKARAQAEPMPPEAPVTTTPLP